MALTKVDPTVVADQVFGRRNLIINGDMRVAQRGTSATALTSSGIFLIDRFQGIESTNGAATVEQSSDTPAGFAKSLKLAVTTADTDMGGGQYSRLKYVIEAQDLQRLNYGTSDAETITLSFWVKSSKTGTYCFSLVKHDSTAYYYVKEYTISSANTWEKKTITITPTAGSTTLITNSAGAIADDNGDGLQLGWFLSAGTTYNGATNDAWSSNSNHFATSNQVNWMDSTSNDFYLTGVQLEVGSQATPFEHRSIGEEINLCQRYYEQSCGTEKDMKTTTDYYASATAEKYNYQGFTAHNNGLGYVPATIYRIQKRTTPSVTLHTGTGLVSGSPSANQVLVYRAGTWAYGAGSYTGWASSEGSLSFHVTYPSISGGNETTSQLMIYGWVADAEL